MALDSEAALSIDKLRIAIGHSDAEIARLRTATREELGIDGPILSDGAVEEIRSIRIREERKHRRDLVGHLAEYGVFVSPVPSEAA